MGTPWLDDDEQGAWRSWWEATIRVQAEIERDLRAAGLTHAYYEILVRLSEAPERTLRMSELALASISSRSRLSHAVARLEEQGLVRREATADDRRGQLCMLTDAGFATLETTAPAHVRTVRGVLLDGLSREQLLALGAASAAVNAHLDSRTDASTGSRTDPPALP